MMTDDFWPMTPDEEALDGITDPRQLRAMLVGRADTIAELRQGIADLRAQVTALGGDLRQTIGQRNALMVSMQDRLLEHQRLAARRLPTDVVDLQAKVSALTAELADARHAIQEHAAAISDDAPLRQAQPDAAPASAAAPPSSSAPLTHSRIELERLSSNHRLFRESLVQRAQETATLLEETGRMRDELAKAPDHYAPSQFWEEFFRYNTIALTDAGLSNFKLTVNQNYQNFIPRSLADPKVRFLLKWFLKNPSLRPLFATIMSPDGVASSGYLADPGTRIFPDPDHLAIYKVLVTLGWDYMVHHDPLRLAERLAEPELGNPIRVCHDGKLISQDLATSVSELTDFIGPLLDRIGHGDFGMLEIGGGYGRLAHATLSTLPARRYVIVDIPPALYVSRWYLQRLFPDKTVFSFRPFERWSDVAQEAEAADILFFLPHQIELIPNGFVDIAVAVSSLHEMRLEQANNYLTHMGRLSRHIVGSKQYFHYVNPYDNIMIEQTEYLYPEGFDLVSSTPDRLNPTFFVDVLRRRGDHD